LTINISKMLKHMILILTLPMTTFLYFEQKEHLEPAKDFSQYEGVLKEYYDNVFPLLYSGFSEMPYARYTSMPSFSAEYAFSVEKINEKNYIISNKFSENFWYAGYDEKGNMDNKKRNTVKITTVKTEINDDLYLIIGELFGLLAKQTKVYEKNRTGLDGVTYYFTTTDKNCEIKTGETWSPSEESLLERLVKICDELHSIGVADNIDQAERIKEITILINDLKE